QKKRLLKRIKSTSSATKAKLRKRPHSQTPKMATGIRIRASPWRTTHRPTKSRKASWSMH
ncbi:Hypothetical predicted protein, partial [Pelobates cultripes]